MKDGDSLQWRALRLSDLRAALREFDKSQSALLRPFLNGVYVPAADGGSPVFESALFLWQELCGTLWRRFSPNCRSDAFGVSYEEPMEVRFSARLALYISERPRRRRRTHS